MKGKGAQKCWLALPDCILQVQECSILKRTRCLSRPAWLRKEVTVQFQCKKAAYKMGSKEKQGYKSEVKKRSKQIQAYRYSVREPKIQQDLQK